MKILAALLFFVASFAHAQNYPTHAIRVFVPFPPGGFSDLYARAIAAKMSDTFGQAVVVENRPGAGGNIGVDLIAKGYGENLATFGSSGTLKGGTASTAQQAVSAWAAEQACWTVGTIGGTEKCDKTCYTNLHSDGCGHYTQIVWRGSTELGCGVGTCKNGARTEDIWICNYAPPGNFIGRMVY